MTEPVISVEALGKSYGSGHALDAISFEGAAGDIVGVVGPTYVIRLLRGLSVGQPWSGPGLEVAVPTGFLVVCGAISARFFRWR